MKKIHAIVLSCLLLSSLYAPSTAFAEGFYLMTEQELTSLENNLATLKIQREKLLKELATLNEQQTKLEKQLSESKQSLTKVEIQLQEANKSFEQYAREEKSKLSRSKNERNICYVIIAGLLYAYIRK